MAHDPVRGTNTKGITNFTDGGTVPPIANFVTNELINVFLTLRQHIGDNHAAPRSYRDLAFLESVLPKNGGFSAHQVRPFSVQINTLFKYTVS